jgi:hypothetical protein
MARPTGFEPVALRLGIIGERNGSNRHGGWTKCAVDLRRDAAALLKDIRKASVFERNGIGSMAATDPLYSPNDMERNAQALRQ